jgi:hypothetical protein
MMPALPLVCALLFAAVSGSPSPPIDPDWGGSAIWDDGLAEVAHYDAHRQVYGRDRSFETILITVKEEFDASLAVKADPPLEGRRTITVLKLNAIARIPTEDYPYNYMTSLFVRRDDPRRLVKLAQSSQEWCGTTYKEVVTWDGPTRLEFRSYFDGQADGRFPLPLDAGALLEEQLPIVLRAARLRPGESYDLSLYDTLVTNAAAPPRARPVKVALAGMERLTTPAGDFQASRIEVRESGEKTASGAPPFMTFWVQEGGTRALLRMECSDGRTLLLTGISRRNYWSR